MNVWILGSGSRGNAMVLEADGARVLIDAGFPARALAQRLAAASIPPESICALVLTHEHTDHMAGACVAARRWGWPVYATAGTIAAAPALARLHPVRVDSRGTFAVGTMQLRCVRTPHDAAEPIALVVDGGASGGRLALAYDLGHVPHGLEAALHNVDALIVEANHDDDMLRASQYPPVVQRRIAGSHGHLSNRAAGALVRSVAHRGLRHVVLAHLSENSNTAATARTTVGAALRGSAFRGQVTIAPQDAVTQFTVYAERRVEQLSLF